MQAAPTAPVAQSTNQTKNSRQTHVTGKHTRQKAQLTTVWALDTTLVQACKARHDKCALVYY